MHAQKSSFFSQSQQKLPKKVPPPTLSIRPIAPPPFPPSSAPLDPTARYAELRRKYSRRGGGGSRCRTFFWRKKADLGLDAGSSDCTWCKYSFRCNRCSSSAKVVYCDPPLSAQCIFTAAMSLLWQKQHNGTSSIGEEKAHSAFSC